MMSYDLASMSSSCLDAAGRPLPFEEQLSSFAFGKMPSGDVLVVAESLDAVGITEIEGNAAPLLMRQRSKRNLAHLIENTVDLGKRVYTNERTGGWIRRTGLPLPERIANRLQANCTTGTCLNEREASPFATKRTSKPARIMPSRKTKAR